MIEKDRFSCKAKFLTSHTKYWIGTRLEFEGGHASKFYQMIKENPLNWKRMDLDNTNLAQSADEVYKGSYRYQDPDYIFLKEINEKMIAVIDNATDGEYITSINPISGQMEDLQSNGNIGLDTRPSMQLTLRLRGPKNNNL